MSEQTDLLDLLAASPVAGRQDEQTTQLLAVIAGDPVHAEDRRRVVAAIVADADANGGAVDPNRVRGALTNDHGLDVTPTAESWTVTGPCPADDCSIAVVLPAVTSSAVVSLALVARLNAAGARLLDVHPASPATDIVPIAVPHTSIGGGAA